MHLGNVKIIVALSAACLFIWHCPAEWTDTWGKYKIGEEFCQEQFVAHGMIVDQAVYEEKWKWYTLVDKVYRLKRESALLGLILCYSTKNGNYKDFILYYGGVL